MWSYIKIKQAGYNSGEVIYSFTAPLEGRELSR